MFIHTYIHTHICTHVHTVSARIAAAVASNIIDKGRAIPMDNNDNLLSICNEYMYSPEYETFHFNT